MDLRIVVEAVDEDADYWPVRLAIHRDIGAEVVHEARITKTLLLKDPSDASLDWYFRHRIQMPFLQTARVSDIFQQMKDYGKSLCDLVMPENSLVREAVRAALMVSPETVHFRILGPSSFQSLRWELLRFDEDSDPFAVTATFTRGESKGISRYTSTRNVAIERLNVLLVTARTHGKSDIDYRTISRALVESIGDRQSTCNLHILRPGTLMALQKELASKGPGFYHIVHFDAHGMVLDGATYARLLQSPAYVCSETMELAEGEHLAFLELRGQTITSLGRRQVTKDLVASSTLGSLLNLYGAEVCLFNACDSASTVSSMAEEILSRGTKVVLGMRHALSEIAATTIARQVYANLMAGKSFARATLAARQRLWQDKERIVFFGAKTAFEDWQLPVVYALEDISYSFPASSHAPADGPTIGEIVEQPGEDSNVPIPPLKSNLVGKQITLADPSHGAEQKANVLLQENDDIIGRDYEILEMEYALLEERNILLLRGLGGVGKSSLLKHLWCWWQRTGFCEAAFFYEFSSRIWTLEQLVDDLGRQIYFTDTLFPMRTTKEKEKLVISAFHEHRFVLIFDNMEAITGPSEGIDALDVKQQRNLKRFLSSFTNSSSFLLLGSRREERWLSSRVVEDNVQILGGLDPASGSLLVRNILQQYNQLERVTVDDLRCLEKISSLLDRHPLAMKSIIGAVRSTTPEAILHNLQSNKMKLESHSDLLNCIQFSYSRLPETLKQRLLQLAPFGTHIMMSDLQAYSVKLGDMSGGKERVKNLDTVVAQEWSEAMREVGHVGLATHVKDDPDMVVLHPSLPQFVRQKLAAQKSDTTQDSFEQMQEALLTCVRGVMQPFADHLDLTAPVPTISELLRRMGFSYDNYRRALDVEIAHMNRGVLVDTPLIWVAFCVYFDQTSKFQEALDFDERIRRQLDLRTPSTKLFMSEILNHISVIQQQLQDRNSALKTLKNQLSILNAEELIETTSVKLEPEGVTVQQISEENSALAGSRAKCYEQLANLSVASGKLQLGVKCQYLSFAWRRLTHYEAHIVRGMERIQLDFLSRLFPLIKDDLNARRCRYGYIIRSLEMKVWENVVSALVINRKIDAFQDSELPDVEILVLSTIKYLQRGATDYSLPDFYSFLVDIAIRKDEVEKAIQCAERALAILKVIGRDARETHLHMKLAEWYENKRNFPEARNSWQNALRAIPPTGDLGDLVTQEKALTGLLRTETRLENLESAKIYADLLEKRTAAANAIAKQTLVEKGDIIAETEEAAIEPEVEHQNQPVVVVINDTDEQVTPSPRISDVSRATQEVERQATEPREDGRTQTPSLTEKLQPNTQDEPDQIIAVARMISSGKHDQIAQVEGSTTEADTAKSGPTSTQDPRSTAAASPATNEIVDADLDQPRQPLLATAVAEDADTADADADTDEDDEAAFWAELAAQIEQEARKLEPTITNMQKQLDRDVEVGEGLLQNQPAFFAWLTRQMG